MNISMMGQGIKRPADYLKIKEPAKKKPKLEQNLFPVYDEKRIKCEDRSEIGLTELTLVISKKGNWEMIKTKPDKDNDGNKILCRHLSWAWLFNKETYFTDFNSDNIRNIACLMENQYDKESIQGKATDYYFNLKEEFGSTLEQICQSLEVEGTINALLHSFSHTMAITIANKGSKGFLIELYDPTKPFGHLEISSLSIDKVKQLKLTYILKPNEISLYFKCSKTFCLSVYKDLNNLPGITKSKSTICNNLVPEEDIIYYSLAFGLTELVEKTVGYVLEHARLKDKKEYLNKVDVNKCPGLYMALQGGYTETVIAFVKLVLNTPNLTNEEKFILSLAKCERDQEPGLYQAFCLEKTEAILQFVSLVLDSTLSEEEKVKLLAAINVDGQHGLAEALSDGSTDLVLRFTSLVLNSINLTEANKVYLLEAKDSIGEVGLSKARKNGYLKTVAGFRKLITGSSLTNPAVVKLISK